MLHRILVTKTMNHIGLDIQFFFAFWKEDKNKKKYGESMIHRRFGEDIERKITQLLLQQIMCAVFINIYPIKLTMTRSVRAD